MFSFNFYKIFKNFFLKSAFKQVLFMSNVFRNILVFKVYSKTVTSIKDTTTPINLTYISLQFFHLLKSVFYE